MTAQTNPDKKHYWSAAVTINFIHEEKPLEVSMMALTSNSEKQVTQRMLKNIQVQVQIQLAQNLGEQLPEVKSVVINSINYLGHMTMEEFLDEQPNSIKH